MDCCTYRKQKVVRQTADFRPGNDIRTGYERGGRLLFLVALIDAMLIDGIVEMVDRQILK